MTQAEKAHMEGDVMADPWPKCNHCPRWWLFADGPPPGCRAEWCALPPTPLTADQRHALGGYYCQNCSRVLMERQGDICPGCRAVQVERTRLNPDTNTYYWVRTKTSGWSIGTYRKGTGYWDILGVGKVLGNSGVKVGDRVTPCAYATLPPIPKTPAETYWVRVYPGGLWSTALRVDVGWLFPGRGSAVDPSLVAEVGARVEPPTP